MGKFLKKAKMDVNSHAKKSLGVCTRSQALRLKKSMASSPISTSIEVIYSDKSSDDCYLQLRSRRVERIVTKAKKKKLTPKRKGCRRVHKGKRVSLGKSLKNFGGNTSKEDEKNENSGNEENPPEVIDSEFEGQVKTTKEMKPSHTVTSGSITTEPHNSIMIPINKTKIKRSAVPSDYELDEFFARAEKQRIEEFIEKYNFDPVNEMPLPGRYEWVEIKF